MWVCVGVGARWELVFFFSCGDVGYWKGHEAPHRSWIFVGVICAGECRCFSSFIPANCKASFAGDVPRMFSLIKNEGYGD